MNIIENIGTNPHTCKKFIYDRSTMTINWGKDSLFNKRCWENRIFICKRMKLDHYLSSYTKIKSKWIKDLNLRYNTMKLVKILQDIGLGKHRQP